MMRRRKFHRTVFWAASAYNMSWGLLSVLDPQWLFRLGGMRLEPRPELVTTVGMVIGLYGLLFLQVAREPEYGWPIAAVALAGKVLGTVGLAVLIARGDWPGSSFLYIAVPNDIVWWGPLTLYLHDVRSWRSMITA